MVTIDANLQAVRQRIANAAQAASRNVADIGLIAVSKGHSVDDIVGTYSAGQRVFGESIVQEALPKMAALEMFAQRQSGAPDASALAADSAIPPRSAKAFLSARAAVTFEWHYIGPIQSNKTRLIAENFGWVHSVDRFRVAQRLSAARPPQSSPLQICLEVNLGGEETKHGVSPDETLTLARAVAGLPGLKLRGLMAIPPYTADVAQQRRHFAQLRALKGDLTAAGVALDTLSMGMSHDLEAAVAEGATLVRVGTAIFGPRL